MKAILAEKPSVAREIARIVGAKEKRVGYFEGSDYCVTWALGHLIQPSMPEGYGVKGFHRDNLPIIPPIFKLVPRQKMTEAGMRPDAGEQPARNSLTDWNSQGGFCPPISDKNISVANV